ncbi:MAG: ATP-binding protein [Sulfolobales archaeon]
MSLKRRYIAFISSLTSSIALLTALYILYTSRNDLEMFYIVSILLGVEYVLYITLMPLDLIVASLPATIIISWLMYLRAGSKYLLLTLDPLFTILFSLLLVTPALYKTRSKVKPPLLIISRSNISHLIDHVKSHTYDLLLDLGLTLTIVSLINLSICPITLILQNFCRDRFNVILYFSGTIVSSLMISTTRKRIFLLITLFSWSTLPLAYYLYTLYETPKPSYLERGEVEEIRGLIIRVQSTATLYNKPYYIELSTGFSPHIIILGSTGAGKTLLCKKILLSMIREKMRVVVIDLNGEYRDLGVKRVRIENILGGIIREVFSSRESLEDFIDAMKSIFRLGPIQVSQLTELLQEFILQSREPKDLISYLERKISESKDSGDERVLRSLIPYFKLILEYVQGESTEERLDLEESVIVDLEKIRSNSYLIEISSYYVIRYIWHRIREKGFSDRVKYVLVVDEAHNILRGKTQDLILQIFRESRKYGFGVILITQQLDERIVDLINNTGRIIVMKIIDPKTIDMLRNMIRESEELVEEVKSLRELEFISLELTGARRVIRGRIIV